LDERKDDMTLIFPVWSHFDRDSVSGVREAAMNSSISVELCDEISLRSDWWSIALANIHRSDCALLVLTTNSATSENCRREVSYARAIGKRTLIWAPRPVTVVPDWARHARWLSIDPIDAGQAVAILNALSR
jgi:hypothetical protein